MPNMQSLQHGSIRQHCTESTAPTAQRLELQQASTPLQAVMLHKTKQAAAHASNCLQTHTYHQDKDGNGRQGSTGGQRREKRATLSSLLTEISHHYGGEIWC